MQVRVEDRGVAVQVGVAILLAFVVLAIAAYQTQVVPQQNTAVEFNHNQQVQSQLQDVRNGVVTAAGGGVGPSVTVQLGTSYPERTIFVNPSPPSGQLRALQSADLAIDNARAASDEETRDYWDASTRTVSTRALTYRPEYNVYQNAPVTTYESTVLANTFRSTTLPVTDQRLVRGRTISVVTLEGGYQEAGAGTVSVDVESLSGSGNRVAVTNPDPNSPIELTVPTTLPESTWRDLLEDQRVANGGNVAGISYATRSGPYNDLTITLETGVTYELQMARVGVENDAVDPGAAYLTDVAGDGASIEESQTATLVAAVRDRFNNPVSGEAVRFSTSGGTFSNGAATITVESDEDGRADVAFSPDSSGTKTVTAEIDADGDGTFGGAADQEVTFTVEASSSGGGSSAYAVDWTAADASPSSALDCNADLTACTLDASQSTTADLTAGTTPVADGSTVEFSVGDSSVGTVSPSEATTDGAGEATTTFTANQNGVVNVYAASGGSGDVIEITVENAGGGGGPSLEYDAGSATTSGQDLSFSLTNTGGDVTLDEFSVEYLNAGEPQEIRASGGSPEVQVTTTTDGSADAGTGNSAFATDNTTYAFDTDPTVGSGDTASVDIEKFRMNPSWSSVSQVGSKASADLSVTLYYSGGQRTVYFETN